MKKNYLIKLVLTALLFLGFQSANAQCLPRSGNYYGELLPNNGCGVFSSYTPYDPGTYFRMPVLQGASYTISTCGSSTDTQITGFQGTDTGTSIFYNDDSGPDCAGLQASVTYVPTFTDYIRPNVNQYDCQPGGTSSITVKVRQNNNLSITSSSAAMCAGQTRTLTATPAAVVVAPPAGAGNVGTFSGPGVSGTTFTAPTPVGASQTFTITYTFGYCTTTQNILVHANPTTAAAGANQLNVCGSTTTLAGNVPAIGTGAWSTVSGPGVATSPGAANSGVTGLTIGTTTTMRWTISNGTCPSSQSTVQLARETTPPVPSVASLANVTGECSATPTAPFANDACAGVLTGTTPTTFPITAPGTTVVTWTYNDGNGNTATQNQNVIITDVTAPVASIPALPNATGQCSATPTTPTALDNCSGTINGVPNVTFPVTAQGTTVVTWTYTDLAGNSFLQAQNVVIDDVTAPVPTLATLADVIATCEVTSLTAPTATDNCAGPVTVSNNAVLPITAEGTTVVTWTYNDGNGNTSTQAQNVVIDDVTAPVPTLATLADVTAACQVTSLTAPSATDNCAVSVIVTNNAVLPITTQGTTVVTWTYNDGNGNTSTQAQNVVIDDVTAPVPTLATLTDVTAACQVTSLTAPSATDNCAVSVIVTNNAVLPITTQGTTVVTWTYNDGNGNTSTQAQNVVIDDVTAPVPTLATLADVTATCQVASLTAPTATDNCAVSVIVTNNAVLPITAQGTTVVTWTYNDGNGNTSTQAQNVVIDDVTAPVPTLATLADVTAACQVTSLTAPTATDNCAASVIVTNNAVLPITTQGTTIVTWTYDDGNGNTTTQTQNVIIDDVTAPAADLATLADVTGNCSVTPTAPTATDNCSGTITGTSNVTFPIITGGATVLTWTYTDGNGNSSTQNQTVIVNVADVSATQNGSTITANATGATYQWLDCDNAYAIIPGATSQAYTPTVTGNYAVKVTQNTCTDTSACFLVDFTSIEELTSIDVSIYPNPSNGKFNVELGGLEGEDLELRILDIQGRIVLSETFKGISGSHIQKVDISREESGVYIINLIGEQGVLLSRRIVKE